MTSFQARISESESKFQSEHFVAAKTFPRVAREDHFLFSFPTTARHGLWAVDWEGKNSLNM
jgi:hypothetical protein